MKVFCQWSFLKYKLGDEKSFYQEVFPSKDTEESNKKSCMGIDFLVFGIQFVVL